MILCFILFLVLFFGKKRIPDKKIWLVLFCCNSFALLLFVGAWKREQVVQEIERNSYGEGNRTETYYVSVDGELNKEELTLEIGERRYTQEEAQELFQKVMKELDDLILGENESRDHVEHAVVLPDSLEEYPVDIRWEMDRYDILSLEGVPQQENLPEEGRLLELRGILTYESYEAVYVTHLHVFPKTLSGKEKWLSDIRESFKKQEEASREDERLILPQSVEGKKLTWIPKSDKKGYLFLILGAVVSALLWFQKWDDLREAEKKRSAQMMVDYPEIVSKFAMLLGTGMTVKNAWNKIAQTYEQEKAMGKYRFAYEELCFTCREIQGGITELEAYERFGKRCKMNVYMKFSMLLSQNLRKGSKGLAEILKMESIQAFEQRKSYAKKRGEEASTKLMLPMFAMFAVVLVIIMIPAFLSIQL
jgi:hypothetical protein